MNLEGFSQIEADLVVHYTRIEEVLQSSLLEFPSTGDLMATAESSMEWICTFQAAQCRVGNWHTRTSLKKMQVLQVIKTIEESCQYTVAKPYLTKLNKHYTRLTGVEGSLEYQSTLLNSALFSLKSIQSCATARHLYEE